MSEKLGLITCPNLKCHRTIEQPILLSNLSTSQVEQYSVCPYCFIQLDPISTQLKTQKEEKTEGYAPLVESLEEEEKSPSVCAGYLGYLSTFPKNKSIPRECLICPRVLDCVMKTRDY
ncbi:MAG: hypothetical protein JSV75_03265 [Candidatus Bathyarchaeota archaeon]|nr:MAG: hypothetical protein JSV75_03265 [Candidatus Bathyarchaeota archaeon]